MTTVFYFRRKQQVKKQKSRKQASAVPRATKGRVKVIVMPTPIKRKARKGSEKEGRGSTRFPKGRKEKAQVPSLQISSSRKRSFG